MSRMALALLLMLAPASTAGAQGPAPVTAEQAMANYREAFPTTRELDFVLFLSGHERKSVEELLETAR